MTEQEMMELYGWITMTGYTLFSLFIWGTIAVYVMKKAKRFLSRLRMKDGKE